MKIEHPVQNRICTGCGKSSAASAAFCTYCGSKTIPQPPLPVPPPLPGPTLKSPPDFDKGRLTARGRVAASLLLALLAMAILDLLPIIPAGAYYRWEQLRFWVGVFSLVAYIRWCLYTNRMPGTNKPQPSAGLLRWLVPARQDPYPSDVRIGLLAFGLMAFLWLFEDSVLRQLDATGWMASAIVGLEMTLHLIVPAMGYRLIAGVDSSADVARLGTFSPALLLTLKPIAIAAGLIWLAAVSGLLSLLDASPERSLARLGDAFELKDQRTFDAYFDANQVLYNVLWHGIGRKRGTGADGPDSGLELMALVVGDEYLNRYYPMVGPFIARNMASLVVSGRANSVVLRMLDGGPSGMIGGMLDRPKRWGDELRDQFHGAFRGATVEERRGLLALVRVNFAAHAGGRVINTSGEVIMRHTGSHWKVVEIIFWD